MLTLALAAAALACAAPAAEPLAARVDFSAPFVSPDPGRRAIEAELARSGPFGVLRSTELKRLLKGAVTPVSSGFQALGPAGKTGSVDGPGKQGNGAYRVLVNAPFEVSLAVRTGYVDGTLTLKRDPATGADTMRFAGRMWADGKWGAPVDKTSSVSVSYDAGADRGAIRWLEDGQWKQEGYWGGKAGRRAMTIELAGGWDHDFAQD